VWRFLRRRAYPEVIRDEQLVRVGLRCVVAEGTTPVSVRVKRDRDRIGARRFCQKGFRGTTDRVDTHLSRQLTVHSARDVDAPRNQVSEVAWVLAAVPTRCERDTGARRICGRCRCDRDRWDGPGGTLHNGAASWAEALGLTSVCAGHAGIPSE